MSRAEWRRAEKSGHKQITELSRVEVRRVEASRVELSSHKQITELSRGESSLGEASRVERRRTELSQTNH